MRHSGWNPNEVTFGDRPFIASGNLRATNFSRTRGGGAAVPGVSAERELANVAVELVLAALSYNLTHYHRLQS